MGLFQLLIYVCFSRYIFTNDLAFKDPENECCNNSCLYKLYSNGLHVNIQQEYTLTPMTKVLILNMLNIQIWETHNITIIKNSKKLIMNLKLLLVLIVKKLVPLIKVVIIYKKPLKTIIIIKINIYMIDGVSLQFQQFLLQFLMWAIDIGVFIFKDSGNRGDVQEINLK